jgi:hypothetical protein
MGIKAGSNGVRAASSENNMDKEENACDMLDFENI